MDPNQTDYVLQKVHHRFYGRHIEEHTLTQKAIQRGYYWLTIYKDAECLVKGYKICQLHSPLTHLPQTELYCIQNPCSFYQWGIDIVRPFPEAPEHFKFLVVAVDYFSKWVEAEPLATISGKNVLKFV